MEKAEILDRLRQSVLDGDKDAATKAAEDAIAVKMDPLEAINDGLIKGVREVGEKFEGGEYFLLNLITAGSAMKAGLDVLKPELIRQKGEVKSSGKIVIGTVAGDIHDIGKTIVIAMLTAHGFEIIDLGVDVPDDVFVGKVRETRPDVLGMSSLLTTSMPRQEIVIKKLKETGLRDSVKVIIGGAVTIPVIFRGLKNFNITSALQNVQLFK